MKRLSVSRTWRWRQPVGLAVLLFILLLSNATRVPGATGATGATGQTGTTGLIGVTGATGQTGTTGLIGVTGATGAAGSIGPIGLTGATGAAGSIGPIGLTGATGAAGSIGPIGLTGAVGATGPTGTIGLTGAVGPAGPTGATGPAGPSGGTTLTTWVATGVAIDLSKQAVILGAGTWTLANGTEGQVIYFVSATGTVLDDTEVLVANLRLQHDHTSTLTLNADWHPFRYGGSNVPVLAIAIFTQGAWNVSAGTLH